jgi:hypothetical protein
VLNRSQDAQSPSYSLGPSEEDEALDDVLLELDDELGDELEAGGLSESEPPQADSSALMAATRASLLIVMVDYSHFGYCV